MMDLFRFIIWKDFVSRDAVAVHPWFKYLEEENLTCPVMHREGGDEEALLLVCRFCHCDIWNMHFRCPDEKHSRREYVVCNDCYAQGRGCQHRATTSLSPQYLFSLETAMQEYQQAAKAWKDSSFLNIEMKQHPSISENWNEGQVDVFPLDLCLCIPTFLVD